MMTLFYGSPLIQKKKKIDIKYLLTILEISHREDIPNSVIQHPVIQTLLDISNDIVCWTNVRIPSPRPQADFGTWALRWCLIGRTHRTSLVLIRNKPRGWVRTQIWGANSVTNWHFHFRITVILSPLYASKRKFRSNLRSNMCLSWLNRQSVAGLTCAPKFRNSIHTRMRLFQNTSRKLSVLPGKALADPYPASSILFGIWQKIQVGLSIGTGKPIATLPLGKAAVKQRIP